MYINNVWRVLEPIGNIFSIEKNISGRLQKLNYNTVQHEVIMECISNDLYKEYERQEAEALAEKILDANVISGFCGGVYIYLTDKINGIPQKLTVYRFNGGIQKIICPIYPGALLPLGRAILCKHT